MEDHWLDGLARAVASEQLSRRELWRRGAKAGFAVASVGLLSGCGATSKQQLASTCNVTSTSSQITRKFATAGTFQGRSLSFNETTVLSAANDLATTTIIALGGRVLLQTNQMRPTNGPIQITTHFGSGFHGPRELTLITADDEIFNGTLDGRALAPFKAGATSIVFADGTPLPAGSIDSPTADALQQISQKAKQEQSTACAESVMTPSPAGASGTSAAGFGISQPLALFGSVRLAKEQDSCCMVTDTQPLTDPNCCVDENASFPSFSSGCQGCRAACDTVSAACGASLALGCAATLFGYALCFGLGMVGCLSELGGCYALCSLQGAPCCPTKCGGSCCLSPVTCCGSTCCDSDAKCSDPNAGLCCPQDAGDACGGICCPTGQVCADANERLCCASGHGAVCGTGAGAQCCSPGQVCDRIGNCCNPANFCAADNTCCLNGSVCTDQGCVFGSECGNTTCGLTEHCCNNACCAGTCYNDASGTEQCCPDPQLVCGTVCCPTGQYCQDATTSTCLPDGTCPAGYSICRDGKTCCASYEFCAQYPDGTWHCDVNS